MKAANTTPSMRSGRAHNAKELCTTTRRNDYTYIIDKCIYYRIEYYLWYDDEEGNTQSFVHSLIRWCLSEPNKLSREE